MNHGYDITHEHRAVSCPTILTSEANLSSQSDTNNNKNHLSHRHVRKEINWNVCLGKVKQFDKRLEAAHVEKTFYFNRELRTLRLSCSVCQERIPSPSRVRGLQLLHYLYDADLSRGQTIGKISSNFVSPLDLTNVLSAFDADLICLNFYNFELSSGFMDKLTSSQTELRNKKHIKRELWRH